MSLGHAHALYVHGHSPVHRLAPEAKIVAAFGFVAVVAVTPREALWAFGAYAVLVFVGIAVARIPARFVAVRLGLVLPFVAFAFLVPFVAGGEQVEVLGVAVSREGLWGMWNVLAKATLGAATSILLAATTELPHVLTGLARLRVPRTFTAIAAFMVRYVEVLADEVGRMRTAMTARGHDPRWLWQARPLATAAGALFVRSYERGERIHAAMLARGYDGTMPDLGVARATSRAWALAAAPPALAATVLASATLA